MKNRVSNFFKLDGNYDVICSDSLLGINYKQIESISVGYKTDYEMFSMDFEEFLWAMGYDNSFIEEISRVFDSIPVQLAKDYKKFQISKVVSGARFHDYTGCIEWL